MEETESILAIINYILNRFKENGFEMDEPEEVEVHHLESRHNTPKACYDNACRIVIENQEDAVYVLGFVTVAGFPLDHAWVKMGDAYADSTLDADSGIYRYFKVLELPRLEMMTIMLATKYYPSLYNVFKYRDEQQSKV